MLVGNFPPGIELMSVGFYVLVVEKREKKTRNVDRM
jgi:hypothetical protein